jgi:hypothetical protein
VTGLKRVNGNWQSFAEVGGAVFITAAPSAVASQNAGTTRIDIFVRGDNFALWELSSRESLPFLT